MKIYQIDSSARKEGSTSRALAKKLLDKGDCVAVPTETVYGLAGNAYSNRACNKIFKLKKRPKYNPLIVHYYDIQDLKKDCELNNNFFKLYKKFCPGPITFVLNLRKNSNISKLVTNNKSIVIYDFKNKLFNNDEGGLFDIKLDPGSVLN